MLSAKSPYFAVLPHNLNWMSPENDPLIRNDLPSVIVLVDVGCRGGLPEELWPIRKKIWHIGFDADDEECAKLRIEDTDLHSREIYPCFVGREDGMGEFHLYAARGNSSALKPDARYARLIGGPNFAIERSLQVRKTRLDTFFADNPHLPMPDMIKLDTQGTELEILQGAVECLKTCSLVEVEVEFFPMYEGQPLFHDVTCFMNQHGFQLLYLNRVFSQQRGYQGFAKGQLTFGDAVFAKREDALHHFDAARLRRLSTLLINYGHLDIVHNLVNTAALPFESDDRSFFVDYLAKRTQRWGFRKLQKTFIPWLDKLLLLLLYRRRHNSLTFESDRSWPIR
jgi:FkbM family methyltransferase